VEENVALLIFCLIAAGMGMLIGLLAKKHRGGSRPCLVAGEFFG
jgi:hypothetical protein